MALGKIGQIKKALTGSNKKTSKKAGKSSGAAAPSTSAKPKSKALQKASQKDRVDTVSSAGVNLLNREVKKTKSDPGSSSEVTAHQKKTASTVLGRSQQGSDFDQLSSKRSERSERTRGLLGGSLIDQIAEGKRPASDLNVRGAEPPKELTPGSSVPEFPDLSDETPSSTTDKGGTRKETYEIEGVEYTKSTDERGNVWVSYEKDGDSYREAQYANGGRTVFATEDADDFRYDRAVRYDKEGNLISDAVSSEKKVAPGEPKEVYSESLTGDGTRTTEHKRYDDKGGYTSDKTVRSEDGTVDTMRVKDGEIQTLRTKFEDEDGKTRSVSLDLTPPLDPAKFSEQAAEFAKHGNPEQLQEAFLGLDDKQLHDVTMSFLSADSDKEETKDNLTDFIGAMSAVAGAGGDEVASKLADTLHDAITDESLDDGAINFYTRAGLANGFLDHIGEGGSAKLGVELTERLLKTSQTDGPGQDQAIDALGGVSGVNAGIISAITDGMEKSAKDFEDSVQRVGELNTELALYVDQASHFIDSPEDLEKAQQSFIANHQADYDKYDNLSESMFVQSESLLKLRELEERYDQTDHQFFSSSKEGLNRLDKGTSERIDDALGSERGRAVMASELEKMAQGKSGFSPVLDKIVNDPKFSDEQKDQFYDKIYIGAVAQAGELTLQGDQQRVNRIFDGLAIADPSLTSDSVSLLKDISSGAVDPSDPNMSERLKKGGADSPRLERVFGPSAAILGYTSMVRDGGELDAEAVLGYAQTLTSTIGLAPKAAELLGLELPTVLKGDKATKILRTIGKIDVVLSAGTALQHLAKGEIVEAGFDAFGALGSGLMLTSSGLLTTGGFLLVTGVMIGKGIYSALKPEEINEDAISFFRNVFDDSSNLSDEKIEGMLLKLQKEDADGDLIWEHLGETAEQLGLGPREFLYTITDLDKEERDALLDNLLNRRSPGEEFDESDYWRFKQYIVDMHRDDFDLDHLKDDSVSGKSMEEKFADTIFPDDLDILLSPPATWDGQIPGHWYDTHPALVEAGYPGNFSTPWLDD